MPRSDNASVAVKIVRKGFHVEAVGYKASEDDPAAVETELTALCRLHGHPSFVELLDYFSDEKDAHFLVMECVEGGTLLQKVEQLMAYPESSARGAFYNLLKAVQFMDGKTSRTSI
jgi:serine/threonine protein kinase